MCVAGNCAATSDDIPPLNIARWGFGTVAFPDGRIFVIGGFGTPDRMTPLNTIEVYDPTTGRWSMRSMPVGMGEVRAVGLADGRIYVANGNNLGTILPQGRFYDPAADRWTVSRTSTSLGFVHLSLGSDGAAYMFGGSDFSQPRGYGYIQRYDPADDSMTRLSPLLSPCRDAQSVLARDGRIFILGGSDANVIETFSPSSRAVGREPSTFPNARMGGAATLGADGRIYYVGGFRIMAGVANGPLTESYALDPASGALTSIAPMPEHRAWFGLVARPGGRLTAIGGYSRLAGELRIVLGSTATYTIATNSWR